MSFKNKNIIRQFPFFTHFACLPFIQLSYRQFILNLQLLLQQKLTNQGYKIQQHLKRHNHLQTHLTLFMLVLRRQQSKMKLKEILNKEKQIIQSKIDQLLIIPKGIQYFTRVNKNEKCKQLTVVYLGIDKQSNQRLIDLVDYLIRILLKQQILVSEELKSMRIVYNHKTNKFEVENFHISLFRCKGLLEKQQLIKAFNEANNVSFGGQIQKIKFECKLMDVSTMMAFDQTQFYEPLIRLNLQSISKSVQQIEFKMEGLQQEVMKKEQIKQ